MRAGQEAGGERVWEAVRQGGQEKEGKGQEREITLSNKGVLQVPSAGLWLWRAEKPEGIPSASY